MTQQEIDAYRALAQANADRELARIVKDRAESAFCKTLEHILDCEDDLIRAQHAARRLEKS